MYNKRTMVNILTMQTNRAYFLPLTKFEMGSKEYMIIDSNIPYFFAFFELDSVLRFNASPNPTKNNIFF